MQVDFPEQELAVATIVQVRGIELPPMPLPSGAVKLLAGVPYAPEVILVHVDGSATVGGRAVPMREVMEHGC